jgi:hypothetical protein
MPASADGEADAARPTIRERSWAEVRWRQFRRAPRPVVRAVLSSTVVAICLGVPYLVYDVAIAAGADLPGGDLRSVFAIVYVVVVLVTGTVVTYLIVPQPTGVDGRPRRSAWSAALGFFASVPIAYIGLVLVGQVLEPLLLGFV